MRYEHLDTEGSIFFERQLEHMKAETFDVLYAPLSATKLIPVDSTTPVGAMSVTYNQFDSSGSAKIISHFADDLPTVDIGGKQITHQLKSIGCSFVITLEEIRAAQYIGKSIDAEKAKAAAEVIKQKMNQLAFFGDKEASMRGWIQNNPILVDRTQDAHALWSAATVDQILDDLNAAYERIIDDSNGVFVPDTIVMPIKQYHHISSTPRTANSDTTIKEFFLSNHSNLTIEVANELKGKFAGNKDGFIMYKKSRRTLWQEMPQPFEMMTPQYKNLAYVVPCHARFGGTIITYPHSMIFVKGI